MLLGEYSHSVDAKGRTVLPTELREGLGDSFVVTRGLDGCACIYSMEGWETFIKNIMSLKANKKENRALQRAFLAKSKKLTADKQGRIVLPQNILELAGIEDRLLFVGAFDKVEIWNEERYKAQSLPEKSVEELMDEASKLRSPEDILEDMEDFGVPMGFDND
ncbi:MAG: division/cell wall cluster transcriptional repressor MraZ [Lachnospiraceae bacterium]|nr:division/cell wall cluster transcriptional repressor MraZ [Lachnospiraceae bacterium]